MACAICERPRFIYTHIPKTGGTSLFSPKSSATQTILNHHHLILIGGHRYLRYIGKRYDLDKYLKFATVRNPYDRFISLWLTRTLRTKETLQQFINAVKAREVKWDALKQQCTWIRDLKGNLLTDRILRYENYEEEVRKLFEELSLPKVKLPHLRRTKRDRNYANYYERENQIDFVTDLYHDDLLIFNYSF